MPQMPRTYGIQRDPGPKARQQRPYVSEAEQSSSIRRHSPEKLLRRQLACRGGAPKFVQHIPVGGPITEPKLLPKDIKGGAGIMTYVVPAGHRAITVAVNEVAGVAGFLSPSNHVDVVLTTQIPGSNNENISKIGGLIREHIAGIENTKEIFRKAFWVTMDFYDKNPGVAITAFITVPMRAWMNEPSYRRDKESSFLSAVMARASAPRTCRIRRTPA